MNVILLCSQKFYSWDLQNLNQTQFLQIKPIKWPQDSTFSHRLHLMFHVRISIKNIMFILQYLSLIFLAFSSFLVRTKLAITLPAFTYEQLKSTMSLEFQGIDVCVGVIDPDYKGEIWSTRTTKRDSHIALPEEIELHKWFRSGLNTRFSTKAVFTPQSL